MPTDITAHTCGSSSHNARRTPDIFGEKLGRVLRGEPLRNASGAC